MTVFDAVICAFTGYLWARDGWAAPEAFSGPREARLDDGWIWLPPMAEKLEEADKDQAQSTAAEG